MGKLSKINKYKLKKNIKQIGKDYVITGGSQHYYSYSNSNSNNDDDYSISSMKKYIQKNDPLIDYLVINNYQLTSEDFKDIFLELQNNKFITKISFAAGILDDSKINLLAEELKTNKTITELNIGNNKIGDAGTIVLAVALKINTTLISFIIHSSEIGPDGGTAIAEALKINTTLTKLDISNNKIGDAGTIALAEALKINGALTELNISENRIGDAGAIAIAEALKINTTLTRLKIIYNNIGDNGGTAIAEALKLNKSLTQIDILGNKINKKITKIILKNNIEFDYFTESKIRNLFQPNLELHYSNYNSDIPLDNYIVKTIEFIKGNLKSKKLGFNNKHENEKLFDEYVKNLTLSYDYFNTLIENNCINGKSAISKINDSEKYIIHLHGVILHNIFKLPDNINIVFLSAMRYITCINLLTLQKQISKYLDEYLKNPYCYDNEEIKKLFSEALIYYGGQYCIDLNLSRNDKEQDHVTGVHHMNKGKKDDTYYNMEDAYLYNTGILTNMTLSKFLNTQYNHEKEQFKNPDKQYTILLTSCRESDKLDPDDEDILVFYEQCVKRLNFKLNYDNNKLNNSNNKNNINEYYRECKTKKNKKLFMNKTITITNQLQFKRNNISTKGHYKSRNNSNNINNNSIIVAPDRKEYFIKDLKTKALKLKDTDNVNNFQIKVDFFVEIYEILNFNEFLKLNNMDTINKNTKIKIKIIKYIFEPNYLLMFEFLVFCQLNIVIVVKQSFNNSKSNVFFLEFAVDFMNLRDKDNKLDKYIEISKFDYFINLKILNFIKNNFNNKLTKIIIINDNIDYEAFTLAEELKSNTSLTEVYIHNNKISSIGLKEIAEALKVNTSIIKFDISSNDFNITRIALFAEALGINKTLKELNFSNNNIGDYGIVSLAEALKVNTTLLTLFIHSNQIGDVGAKALAESLKVNNTLISLFIENNKIGPDGGTAIAEALKINKSLLSLMIYQNNCGDSGIVLFAEVLGINTTLTELNFGYNNISSIGGTAIAKALQNNETLTYINISNNNIGNIGAKSLAEALQNNKILIHLDISNNSIDDNGAKTLAEALKNNKTLIELNISSNKITFIGGTAIAEALRVNNKLTELNIEDNMFNSPLSDMIKKKINDFIKRNKSLSMLTPADKNNSNENFAKAWKKLSVK